MPRPTTSSIPRLLAVAAFAAVLPLASGALAQGQGSAMTKQVIKVAERPQAVCNDGTSPVFYFRPGSGDDRNKWIIYLQGGGGCMTGEFCADRARDRANLITSSRAPATVAFDGLLSASKTKNPDFAAFTHVLVHYCSSDFWAGDSQQRVGGSTWQFRGHEIIDALLDQLLGSASGGTALADATEVLVAGESAGAMGVHNNIDRIAERLPKASVKGIADSGWIPAGTQPYGPGTLSIANYSPEAMAFHGSHPDESCVAANPATPNACLNEGFVFPYLTTPTFIFADLRDPILLGMLGIVLGQQMDANQRTYVNSYAQSVRHSLQEVPAYFATANITHTALLNARFSQAAIGGQTLAQTIGAWYFGRPSKLKLVGRPGEGKVNARVEQ